MIDFRSDTVTLPTPGMLAYMQAAPLGDDVFGEDPSINALEAKTASLFGMEAGLFCPSGTMTNQLAIKTHTQAGDEVICEELSHIYQYEGGGIAKNSGASVRLLQGDRGRLTVESIAQWINPDDVHYPKTQLISLEDTANRGGGAIYDFSEIERISRFAKEKSFPLHLDGARLMNALVETGIQPRDYASVFDSISLCLSKGLGAPVGSVLIGSASFIKEARRVRKVFGGGMRQAGMIAAGGLYALKNNVERLKIDHHNALELERCLVQLNWVERVYPVQTNIVVVVLNDASKRDLVIGKLKEQNVLAMAFGPGMVRFVTHLDISNAQMDQTLAVLKALTV